MTCLASETSGRVETLTPFPMTAVPPMVWTAYTLPTVPSGRRKLIEPSWPLITPCTRLALRSRAVAAQVDIPRSTSGLEMNSSGSSFEVNEAVNNPPDDETDRSDTGSGGGLGVQDTTAPAVL